MQTQLMTADGGRPTADRASTALAGRRPTKDQALPVGQPSIARLRQVGPTSRGTHNLPSLRRAAPVHFLQSARPPRLACHPERPATTPCVSSRAPGHYALRVLQSARPPRLACHPERPWFSASGAHNEREGSPVGLSCPKRRISTAMRVYGGVPSRSFSVSPGNGGQALWMTRGATDHAGRAG